MRLMVFAMGLLLAGCSPSALKSGEATRGIDCKGAQTCEDEVAKLIASERVMESHFREAIARIDKCQPINSTKCFDLTGAIAAIKAEQTAWTPWRDTHCDVFAFSMNGTSAEGELKAFCRRDLTEKRDAEIQKVMSK